MLPGTIEHSITFVIADGDYVSGYAEPTSFDVTFFKKIKVKNGMDESKILKSCPGNSFTDLNGEGSVAISVGACGVKVKGGKHTYVSVAANVDFGSNGYLWYWHTNLMQNYKSAQ